MILINNIVLLLVGFFMLIMGADFLVDGAASVARKFKVSNLVIGLTLVSVVTSFPEFMVGLQASLSGNPNLAAAAALGSNLANILFILGVISLFFVVKVKKTTVLTEIPFAAVSLLLLYLLANDFLANGLSKAYVSLHLSRADGLVLLAFFSVFLYYTYTLLKKSKTIEKEYEDVLEEDSFSFAGITNKLIDRLRGKNGKDLFTVGQINVYSFKRAFFYIFVGLFALIFGARLLVDSTVQIGTILNVPTVFLGITVIALGTSLPELATNITAFKKNNGDMAIGNVIGSNIFNTLFVLGGVSLISPLTISVGFNYEIIVTFLVTLVLGVILYFSKGHKLTRFTGIVFLWCYFLYILFKVFVK
jgi:cation:H+ antiporter